MAVTFESMERRMPKIEKCLAEYGIASLEEARELCNSKGFDAYDIVKGVQPIAFENAGWAYTLGCAVAIKKGVKRLQSASVSVLRLSVSRVRLQSREMLVAVTVTSAQCS